MIIIILFYSHYIFLLSHTLSTFLAFSIEDCIILEAEPSTIFTTSRIFCSSPLFFSIKLTPKTREKRED
jgi:hypothetical protein